MTRRHIIRPLAMALAFLSALAATPGLMAGATQSAADTVRALRSRAVLWPWMTQSAKLFMGTMAYNVFALVIVQPLLRKWFPPLQPWEHVTGLFGHSRTTYEQIVPVVATTLWILGNAFLFAMMNRNLRQTQATIAAGGAMTRLDAPPRPGR